MKQSLGSVALLALFLLFLGGCGKQNAGGELGDATGTVAGVKWGIPKKWTMGPERQMRVATYVIPATNGDAEPGECVVSYFGPQSGDTKSNIDRWIGQFEEGLAPTTEEKTAGGMKVTIVNLAGTYLAGGMMMSQEVVKKANFRMLAAIIEGPQGPVYFKTTGPAKTVQAAEADFTAMVESLTK